jgi:protein KTI12
MPLIIMTGFPSSGKTKRSEEIKAFFEERCKAEDKKLRIHVVNDEMLGISKSAYKGESYKGRHKHYRTVNLMIILRG